MYSCSKQVEIMVMGTCSWYLRFAVASYLRAKLHFLHLQMQSSETESELADAGYHLLEETSWHDLLLPGVALDCAGHQLLADCQRLAIPGRVHIRVTTEPTPGQNKLLVPTA